MISGMLVAIICRKGTTPISFRLPSYKTLSGWMVGMFRQEMETRNFWEVVGI